MITVCMPVGPQSYYKRYVQEAIDSVKAQTLPAAELLIIDDMAGLPDSPDYRIWRAPWRLGLPAVANLGIALSKTELVFQMSCDDKLHPDCLKYCWREWLRRKDPLGYYWVDTEYSTGEKQSLPHGNAMVTKTLWRRTGGFAPELSIGACDSAFISILLAHPGKAGNLYRVESPYPLYWHREYPEQYTKQQIVGPSTILEVRGIITKRWAPPQWGRYE